MGDNIAVLNYGFGRWDGLTVDDDFTTLYGVFLRFVSTGGYHDLVEVFT